MGRLTEGRGRFNPATGDHTELLKRFLDAAQNGDVTALAELLAEDAIAYNDGGGKVRAAMRMRQVKELMDRRIADGHGEQGFSSLFELLEREG
ncbi:hypothetical protein [Nonomuraea jabiensis]|uniref:hypothetical protein n=1 Tax=Nonomuraea jabiensis TaxID=882448 RepID=UPI003F4D992F